MPAVSTLAVLLLLATACGSTRVPVPADDETAEGDATETLDNLDEAAADDADAPDLEGEEAQAEAEAEAEADDQEQAEAEPEEAPCNCSPGDECCFNGCTYAEFPTPCVRSDNPNQGYCLPNQMCSRDYYPKWGLAVYPPPLSSRQDHASAVESCAPLFLLGGDRRDMGKWRLWTLDEARAISLNKCENTKPGGACPAGATCDTSDCLDHEACKGCTDEPEAMGDFSWTATPVADKPGWYFVIKQGAPRAIAMRQRFDTSLIGHKCVSDPATWQAR